MGEATSRVETLPQPGNPYAPGTEEYERWWAEIAKRSVSNNPQPSMTDSRWELAVVLLVSSTAFGLVRHFVAQLL